MNEEAAVDSGRLLIVGPRRLTVDFVDQSTSPDDHGVTVAAIISAQSDREFLVTDTAWVQ